ncbi:MAG TPA: methylmalonyl-CoA mutase, partial [Maribacter sp.]|nr:methylmalonyl-CoA mutase [Maribacter sp.]
QLYLQHETNVTKTVDPWAGSYYVEKLTHDMVHKAWELMQEVENLGGMTKAIETGIPKTRIEEAAARKQARIDSEQDVIVGVNKYQLTEEDELQILEVDNKEVRRQQLQRLEEVKANRNTAVVAKKLKELTIAAKNKLDDSDSEENLLALAVSAARERATLGEISSALEEAFGRHKAIINSFTGVYSREIKEDKSFKKAQELADRFAQQDGRRPRIMVAKMGQDGH